MQFMNNVTSTPASANNFPIPQQPLPSQPQASMTSDTGYIEKTPGSHTSINKNQGRGAVSRQLQKAPDSINEASDYAVKTTVNGASSVKELLNDLAEKKKADPEMQVALVSGGSVAGYAAALKLKNCGFHVIVAEKRSAYTRQNSFILKKEALFSLTNLSPDGKLMNHLIDNKLMDVHKSNIVKEGGLFGPDGGKVVKEANPAYRFMNWITNNHHIHSAKIPDRVKQDRETTEYLDLPHISTKKREPFEYLDLAWPKHEAVIPVDPQDWRYSNLGKISQDNLGLCQIRNLEKGLNQHCLDHQENIEIIPAEIDLKETDSEDFKYSPTFIVADNEKKEHIDSPFHFDLICIAEGANSKNAAVVSEQAVIPKVESWYQANYSGPENGLRGFFGALVDRDKKQMAAVQHMGRKESPLVNVSLGIEPDKEFDPDSIERALENSRHICEAAGANVEISERTMEFKTPQRIDVDIKRANTVMRSNAIIIGDSAGSGSPVGALGGSLALSAYPELIERLVKHPDFKKPEKRPDVELFFRKEAAPVVNLRHGIPSDAMRKLGFYSAEVNKQRIKNDVLALFPEASDAQHAANSSGVSS